MSKPDLGSWHINDGPEIPWNATAAEARAIDPVGTINAVAAGLAALSPYTFEIEPNVEDPLSSEIIRSVRKSTEP